MRLFTRYFLVGGIAGLIDLSVFLLLVYIDIHWFIAASISFVLATFANYQLSIQHVFESGVRFKKDHEVVLVFVISFIGLCINWSVLGFLISYSIFPIWFSKIFATGTVFVWNFLVRYYFIFKEK